MKHFYLCEKKTRIIHCFSSCTGVEYTAEIMLELSTTKIFSQYIEHGHRISVLVNNIVLKETIFQNIVG